MRVSSSTFPDNFLYQTNLLQAQQTQLQQEATTGLKLSLPEDNPSAMAQVLNLQADSNANQQYQSNITDLTNQATAVSSTLTSLQAIVSKAGEIATSADGLSSPTALTSYATQVGELIQQALQLGNSKDSEGNYIFGGTDTSTPPFTATTDSSGNVTGVTYSGNTSVNQVQIGQGVTVSAQVPGANTTGSGPAGMFTDSRSGADLFNHLISLQQDLIAGNTTAISSADAPNITNDQNNVANQVSANGVLQARLQATTATETQQYTDLTAQISDKTDANLATTLTNLQQTQTAFQAALQSSTMVMNLTILDFIQ
jgi:flagellar hook-associated protein 3 FlgL